MHRTTTNNQKLDIEKAFECDERRSTMALIGFDKVRFGLLWALLGLLTAALGLLLPIKAVAEQSISHYHPMAPTTIARQEAIKAGLDPKLVLAILWHESRNCKLPTTAKTDLGCMQISRATAGALKLDKYRLTHDVAYNIKAGVAILAYFKRYKAKDKLWWTKYNVGYQKAPKAANAYYKAVGYGYAE